VGEGKTREPAASRPGLAKGKRVALAPFGERVRGEGANHREIAVSLRQTRWRSARSLRFSQRFSLRHCAPFQAGEFGLDKDCVAQAETIVTVESADDTGAVVIIDGHGEFLGHAGLW